MNNLDKCMEQQKFPFSSKLSFTNLIGYWQVRTNDPNKFKALSATEIVKQVNANPEFLQPIDDLSVVDENQELVELILSAVVPPALDEMVSVHVPFSTSAVYSSQSFSDLMNKAGSYEALISEMDMKDMMEQKIVNAYALIMKMYYGVTINTEKYFLYTLIDSTTGLKKHYRIELNSNFCEVILKGKLPNLSNEDIKFLIDNLNNLQIWMDYLPPHLFEFQGIIIFKLRDQTNEEVLSRIKDDLLKRDSIVNKEGFDQLENRFRSLFQLTELKLGIAGYQKSSNSFMNFGKRIVRSILIGNQEGIGCTVTNSSIYDWFVNNPEPIVIDDLSKSTKMGGYEEKLIHEGLQTLILGPLFFNHEFVGLLELATPNAGELNTITLSKVKEVLPLFAVAVKRSSEEMENKIQSIIKEKYTSIHPTVEWKFVNAARDILAQENDGKIAIPKPIIFNDVYPLYAASDIRNSSIERNRAINSDLKEQLQLARKVLKKAHQINNLPILEETIFRLDNYYKILKRKLISGDEVSILEFLQTEVEPLMDNLEANIPDFSIETSGYKQQLDENLGVVYKARKDFEDSLTMINEVTSSVLDEEELKAQEMFPHFFEKYKTDGVEHNIYVGASLSEKLKFDKVYLRNLRLWQLMVTVEIARKTASMIPELPLPLETTHLILVHNAPLSIRFRMDEKKFDVDGAYNIRYEIIKKRIDKALIKDSDERVTQPGKIAIIYSQEKDAIEYMKYVDYLKSKDLLVGEIEHLELEELQGVSGLKALRMAVKIEKSSIMKEVEGILQQA
ncbi:GAF domain-containing protein [Reichenbachiella sp. MALMAid0571]|uniref:GAF domain-containing protein n=1 Tax=Reichenbachiella sp. MALMAid0571 TaxID=3143939 RepID=UPI0032DFBE83